MMAPPPTPNTPARRPVSAPARRSTAASQASSRSGMLNMNSRCNAVTNAEMDEAGHRSPTILGGGPYPERSGGPAHINPRFPLSLHSHERRGEERHQATPFALLRMDLGLGQGQGPPRLEDAPGGEQALASRGGHEVD